MVACGVTLCNLVCINYRFAAYWGVEVQLHLFLTSVPDEADWLIHDLADSPVTNNVGGN